MDERLFLSLSVDLLGDSALSPELAASLLRRLTAVADPATLAQLATVTSGLPDDPAAREEAIRQQIMAVLPLRELAKLVIVLWYTGDLALTGAPPPTENEYFSARLWSIIRAHPPGLSGGYFGHWTYPPDN